MIHDFEAEALRIALEALNDIACWQDGSEVSGKFDEPGSAQAARDALRKITQLLSAEPRETE